MCWARSSLYPMSERTSNPGPSPPGLTDPWEGVASQLLRYCQGSLGFWDLQGPLPQQTPLRLCLTIHK